MKILMQSYEFPPIGGGGSKVVFGLATQLIQLGHEVHVVTMNFRDLPKEECVNGIYVHRVPCIRTHQAICYTPEMASYIVRAIPVVSQLVRKVKFDLNHTHFAFPDGFISLLIKKTTGLPYIITVHGSDVPGYNPDRFTHAHKLLFPVWRRVINSAERIISPSETLKSLILSRCATVPISVIPNGFDENKFLPDSKKVNRILVVSRMFARKGVQYLLKALADWNGQLPYEVHIVGDGPFLPHLRKLCAQSNTEARFWGHLDNNSHELKHLFETSRIFVFTSQAENFPNVLLEAMAAGMAIVSTEGTGCAEVIGKAGILVPVNDARAIGRSLLKLTSDSNLCENLGKAARQRLEHHFTWKVVAKQYQRLYEQTIA
jgi:glycosyltransferase involved in cell wall biosynthesis